MKEAFLHYIWQHQYFDKTSLYTEAGDLIQVIRTGFYNTDAGPDFKEALLKIGDVEWSGSVEIHVHASDWKRHRHQQDRKYDQVILHVVWDADVPVLRTDTTPIPALELKKRIAPGMFTAYTELIKSRTQIPCANFWPIVPDITKTMMLERALTERLMLKGEEVLTLFRQNDHDWERTTYQLLCKGFGFKINQNAFLYLSKSLPWQVARKHQTNRMQVEALVFGMSGFLDDEPDAYAQQIGKEFNYLSHKYNLLENKMQRHQWNFLRMRPANFPTVRLAQLAAVLCHSKSFFTTLLETPALNEYEKLFKVPVSDYWQQHYDFGKESKSLQISMGKGSAHNLIINVVVPLLAAYSNYSQERQYLEKAIMLLEKTREATNNITRLYEELGWQAKSAADNQAALGLYKSYCQPVKCLHCVIGNKILKQSSTL
jgi:hypothetical protein